MSLSGSSASRNSIWAMTRLASSSSMKVGRKMIRSLRRREKISKARSPRGVCSTTMGTRAIALLLRSDDSRVSRGTDGPPLSADGGVLDEEVERHAFAQAVSQSVHISALLHHTTDGGRGALAGAGDPLDLGLDLRLAGGQALAGRDGLQEQAPPDRLLRPRRELGHDLAEVPLGGIGIDPLPAHPLPGVLHLVSDLTHGQGGRDGELVAGEQGLHHLVLEGQAILAGPARLQLLLDLLAHGGQVVEIAQ